MHGRGSLSLVGLIGPELLPQQWARPVERDDDGLREMLTEDDFPE